MLGADFWSSATVHIFLAGLVTLPLVLWDWRAVLPGLLLAQLGIGQVMANVYGLPAPWATVHLAVLFCACLILLLSILQTKNLYVDRTERTGSVFFRLLVLGMAAFLVWSGAERVELPLLTDRTGLLFLWLLALAVLTLSLSDSVLFAGIGLLLWLVPVQALLSVLFPFPALIGLLGIAQILIALACSYLLVAEDEQLSLEARPSTDPGGPTYRPLRRSIPAGAAILWHSTAYRLASLARRRPSTH